MAEENYKPNGWLGIQLGKQIWVACWSLDKVAESEPLIIQRAKSHLASSPSTAPAAATELSSGSSLPEPAAPPAVPKASSSSANEEILSMLKQMQSDLHALEARMRAEMQSLETRMRALETRAAGDAKLE